MKNIPHLETLLTQTDILISNLSKINLIDFIQPKKIGYNPNDSKIYSNPSYSDISFQQYLNSNSPAEIYLTGLKARVEEIYINQIMQILSNQQILEISQYSNDFSLYKTQIFHQANLTFLKIAFQDYFFLHHLSKNLDFPLEKIALKLMKYKDRSSVGKILGVYQIAQKQFEFLKIDFETKSENVCPFLFFENKKQIFQNLNLLCDKLFNQNQKLFVEHFKNPKNKINNEQLFLIGKLKMN